MRRFGLLLAIVLTGAWPACAGAADAGSAGEPAFDAINLRQGLTSGSIYGVLVDRHGFVWFAGDSGVHRYDGQHVHTIDRDPDRADTLVSRTNAALAETDDAIWILSFGGVLQRLDAVSGAIAHVALARTSDGKTPGRGRRLVADRRGRLWVATDVGLYRIDPATHEQRIVSLYAVGDPRVTALALADDDRRLLVGTVEGRVFAIDTGNADSVAELARVEHGVPLAFAPAPDAVWIGTTRGLFRFDATTRTLDRANVPDDIARERIETLVRGRDGVLWFGSQLRAGLVRFDPASGAHATYRHHADDPHALSGDQVIALTLDSRDNLWIGLQQGGANRLRTSQLGVALYRAGGGHNRSFCGIRDLPDGRLFVARCGGSVAILDTATGSIVDAGPELDAALEFPAPTLTSHAIVPDGAGAWYVTTGGLGLLHWRPGEPARRVPLRAADDTEQPDPYMNDAALDASGRVWVACSLGLARVDADGRALRLLDPAQLPGRWLTGGVLDVTAAGDTLWLGTTQGLVRYEPASGASIRYMHDPNAQNSLSDNLVASTHVDASGTLWVGTQAGLNRAIEGGGNTLTFRRYGVAEGLPDQTIDAITSDKHGTIWVGTNRGIANRDAKRDRFRGYTPADGVPDSGTNWRAALTTGDGSVWFGTTTGLVRVFPDRLVPAEPPPLMLSGYEIAGRTRINLRGPDVLPLATGYTEARVRFQVAAFGDHRRLSYRLTGLEPEWHPMPPGLSIGYDPVPPGSYRFEVRQLGTNGVWEAPALGVALTVAPPPWRTGTAYASYALLAAGVGATVLLGWRRKRALELRHLDALRRLASYDTLTGLPNRTLFGTELAASMTPGAPPLALLFVDLDRFKNINDSLGHGFGDRVLIAAAVRLRDALPADARLARLGGDEFTVVLAKLHHDREAATVAQRLLDAFATPLRVEGSDVVVTLSIGIGLYPEHARDAETLIQYADSAMYYAKAGGRNAYRFFQPEMVAQVSRRLALETGLRHALEHGELHPVFQPLIELATGRVCGCEVLLRWNSADHGAVAPAEFIPILEDTGLIEPVGLWLMEHVCAQVRAWQQTGMPRLCVAVNVSVHQLIRGDLCERLAQLLTTLGIPRHALELEVTESAVMENAERMGAALGELRSLGLGLAIDDFGTGYSSFASLSHLPVSKLKIDKAFIDGVGQSENADTLCAAIIAMAHNLKLAVVAEGVESELQHRRLLAMGCDEAQGFWYCKPLPLDAFEAFVQTRSQQPA